MATDPGYSAFRARELRLIRWLSFAEVVLLAAMVVVGVWGTVVLGQRTDVLEQLSNDNAQSIRALWDVVSGASGAE